MTPDPCYLNRRAAAKIRTRALDDDDMVLLLDMCGLWTADGSIPPDDTRKYDLPDLEIAGGSWAGEGWE